MSSPPETLPRKSRLAALLEHFAVVEDPRDVRRISHRLDEILLLVVCGTIADCDDYEDVAAWGAAHLDFLRRHLPYEHGMRGEREFGSETLLESGRFQIFLSYRRADAPGYAGRLHENLLEGVGEQQGFDDDQIFMDIDTLELGRDFARRFAKPSRAAMSFSRSSGASGQR